MDYCELQTSLRYRNLSLKAGISDFNLTTFILTYYNKYDDFPYLDEIPEVNSEPYIKDKLQIKEGLGEDYLYTDTNTILEKTNTDNIEQAMAELNKESDLNITLLELGEQTLVKIDHRPSEYSNIDINKDYNPDTDTSQNKIQSIVSNRLDVLRKKFGIKINQIDNSNIKDFPVDIRTALAFVYNGEIYVNIDLALPDAVVHEMLHIFLGSVRYTNPDLYYGLVNAVEQLPNIEERISLYTNRTRNDALEEIFVDLFAKYVTGLSSMFEKIPKKVMHKLMYLVIRNIDSFIDGRFSIKSLDTQFIFDSTIQALAQATQSDIINSETNSSLQLAEIHRMVANTKEKLLNNGELIQQCE